MEAPKIRRVTSKTRTNTKRILLLYLPMRKLKIKRQPKEVDMPNLLQSPNSMMKKTLSTISGLVLYLTLIY